MRTALVAIAAMAAPARADDHGRVPIMIADGISDTMMLSLATPLPDDARTYLFCSALLAQVIAAPLVHAGDDDWALAGIDYGARTILPTLGFYIGAELCEGSGQRGFFSCLGPEMAGGLVGVASAQILDWVVLSRITRDASPTPRILSFGARF